MQEKYREYTIQYEEYNNTWTCQVGEVTIKANSLRECREKVDKFINKKSKQSPIKCYVSKYNTGIQEATITEED